MEKSNYNDRLKNTGRNDKCPCGSGKKYKKCHLASDEEAKRKEMLELEAKAEKSKNKDEENDESDKNKVKNKNFAPKPKLNKKNIHSNYQK